MKVSAQLEAQVQSRKPATGFVPGAMDAINAPYKPFITHSPFSIAVTGIIDQVKYVSSM